MPRFSQMVMSWTPAAIAMTSATGRTLSRFTITSAGTWSFTAKVNLSPRLVTLQNGDVLGVGAFLNVSCGCGAINGAVWNHTTKTWTYTTNMVQEDGADMGYGRQGW